MVIAMSKISVKHFNEAILTELPWGSDLGLRLDEVSHGKAIMRLPYDDRSTRPGGTISGPHMMLLADACMFAVVLSMLGDVRLAVTTNLNINFLRKPSQSDLLGTGNIIKLGKRLAVVEVDVTEESTGKRVAHVTGTYSIPPAPGE